MPESDTAILSPDIADKWAKLRMAHEAVMLQDAKEILTTDRQQSSQYQATMLSNGGKPNQSDDMAGDIFIGDVTYQYAAPPATPASPSSPSVAASSPQVATPQAAPPPSPQATPAAQPETATGKLSPWLSSAAVIAASALGGGAAVPIGGAILDWWNSDPPAAVQPAEPTPADPLPSLDHGGVTIEPFKVGE